MDDFDKMKNGVLSLTHLAKLKCINNAHIINDIGYTPYHLVEPILKKKTAKSLKQMEERSPQIIDNSEELWAALLKRDFPDRPPIQAVLQDGKRTNITSRDLYDKYFNERETQRLNAVDNLKIMTKNLKVLKDKTKVKAVDKVLPMTIKKKRQNSSVPLTKAPFKSNLLQKARMANKQRVRNFIQPSQQLQRVTPSFTSQGSMTKLGQAITTKPANKDWVKLGQAVGARKRLQTNQGPNRGKRFKN